jgi:hypothetical protein
VTVTVDVPNGVLVQVASFGPNAVNVIVPVGADPPARTPESLIVPPDGTDDDAVVVTVGEDFVTVTASPGAPQADVAAALFASPL